MYKRIHHSRRLQKYGVEGRDRKHVLVTTVGNKNGMGLKIFLFFLSVLIIYAQQRNLYYCCSPDRTKEEDSDVGRTIVFLNFCILLIFNTAQHFSNISSLRTPLSVSVSVA